MKSALDRALATVTIHDEEDDDNGFSVEQYRIRGIDIGWVRCWLDRPIDAGPGKWEHSWWSM